MSDEKMQKIIMNKHPDTSKEGNYIYLLLPQIYFLFK
jgi:hypothetical protein